MKQVLFTSLLFLALGCDKTKYFDGPDAYSDSFENYANADSMIDGNDEHWSYFQKTYEGNSVSIDTQIVHSGNQSVKSTAAPRSNDGSASKASFAKQKMAFYEGETVSVEAWYYIVGTTDVNWLFIMDLEEQAAIGAGPGMRLAIVDSALVVEHKYLEKDFYQATDQKVIVPRNQWFHVRFETLLSQKDEGYVKIYQDGVLVIEGYETATLPKDILYFQQGTKGMYTSIEFGVTANSGDAEMTVYVDDISAKILP